MHKNRHTIQVSSLIVLWMFLTLSLAGCMPSGGRNRETTTPPGAASSTASSGKMPEIPAKLDKNSDGVPLLNIYDTKTKSIREEDIESYVAGVLAGEMRNDWPIEALKAQAILARTFVMKFISEKSSKYKGADISTDISEAQAYDESSVNNIVKKAVEETRGLVLSYDGEFPYAWFHAHSGGITELPTDALEYDKADPGYVQVVKSEESENAPDDVKNWSVTFSAEEVGRACKETGVDTGAVQSIAIGKKGESGRAVTFTVNGKEVSAPALRLALDGTKLKSTLLKSVSVKGGKVTFAGSGYGHGVGMSQWGAYKMAEDGEPAEAIVEKYFKNCEIVRLWN